MDIIVPETAGGGWGPDFGVVKSELTVVTLVPIAGGIIWMFSPPTDDG